MGKDLVRDWMTRKVLAMTSDTPLTTADVTMEARQLRRLLVVDDGVLTGIVSEGDLKVAMALFNASEGASEGASERQPEPVLRDIMTADPITVTETYTIALAAQTMLSARIGGLPVVDNEGRLVGVLSESDVFRFVVASAR